jgi:hypothetical protein
LAAARSYDFLFTKAPGHPLFDLRYERMRVFYLRALAGFVQQLKRTTGALAAHQRTVFDQPYLVDVASGSGVLDPTTFDELLFAAEMNFEGLANRFRRFGFGLALVGFRTNTHPHPADRFYPNVGTTQAVMVLWRFEPAAPSAQTARAARLYFYNAMQVDAIDLNDVQVPLAADFTAPLGLLMSRTVLKSSGLSQTFSSENWLDKAGFYMTEPFDPHKIPIITVHGLLSSPVTWINLHNDLLDDPVVRQHYQLWHFAYPPGLPILVSAELFREKLEELYTFFDPQAQLPALQNTVIIAHSMGGGPDEDGRSRQRESALGAGLSPAARRLELIRPITGATRQDTAVSPRSLYHASHLYCGAAPRESARRECRGPHGPSVDNRAGGGTDPAAPIVGTSGHGARPRCADGAGGGPDQYQGAVAPESEHPMGSHLLGSTVKNPQGKDLGSIKDLVISPEDNRVVYAVLSFGGVFGLGEKAVAMPLSAAQTCCRGEDVCGGDGSGTPPHGAGVQSRQLAAGMSLGQSPQGAEHERNAWRSLVGVPSSDNTDLDISYIRNSYHW